MRRFLLVLSWLTVPARATLYIKPLPPGISFDGVLGKTITTEDASACAEQLHLSAHVAMIVTGAQCVGYRQIYGAKKAVDGELSFLLVESTVDVCSADLKDELSERLACRPGWNKLTVRTSTACYYMMLSDEYTQLYPDRKNYIYACNKKFDFAHAASIHSQDENDLIITTFRPDKYSSPEFGLKIGLLWGSWTWIDGTPFDFDLINKAGMYDGEGGNGEYCIKAGGDCTHAALYWNDTAAYWTGADRNTRPLLCKYVINVDVK